MKYKTFRALVLSLAVLLGSLGLFFGARACASSPPEAKLEPENAGVVRPESGGDAPRPSPAEPSTTEPASDDPSALRALDRKLLDRVQAGFPGDKVKDAFTSERYKVNLYKEAGVVRAKVDLDRDEKWDEKWDFETKDGQEVVKRRVASKDDESYDVEYRLREGRWVEK
jgi:hypothetical protein